MTRGDAQAKIAARTKSKEKPVTKGTFQRQLAELRKKIKTTIQVTTILSRIDIAHFTCLTVFILYPLAFAFWGIILHSIDWLIDQLLSLTQICY